MVQVVPRWLEVDEVKENLPLYRWRVGNRLSDNTKVAISFAFDANNLNLH